MARKQTECVVVVPANVEVRVTRGDPAAATHELFSLWGVRVIKELLERHISHALALRYGEGIFWDWEPREGWRDLLSTTIGQAHIMVYRSTDEDCRYYRGLVRLVHGPGFATVDFVIDNL